MVDGNGSDRDQSGRFTHGNRGGPGRPRGKHQVDVATLRDLAIPPDGPELYIVAMMLKDREKWLGMIEEDFPAYVVQKIKGILAVADFSQAELVRRLREMPL